MSIKYQPLLNDNQRILLQNMAENLMSTRDWAELVNLIIFSGVRLVGGTGSLFSVYDTSLGDFIIQGSYGFEKNQAINVMNVCKEFIENCKYDDNCKEKRIYHTPYQQSMIYILPLRRNTVDTGLLVLLTPNKDLTDEQVNLLDAFIHTVSIAVENSRLYLQIQRKSHSLTIMNKLHRLVGKGSFQEVLTETVEHIGNLFHVQMAGIMLYDAEQNQLVLQKPAFGVWDETIIEQYRVSLKEGGNAVSVFLSGIPTVTQNALNDARYLQRYVRVFEGTKSIMTVPLTVDERRIGVLHAMGREENLFTQDDLSLLTEISNYLGLILDGALSMEGKSTLSFERTEIEKYFSRQLIHGMLHGQEHELEYINKKGYMLNLPVTPPFTVMSMGLYINGEWYSSFKENMEIIEQTVRTIIPISGVWTEKETITIIFSSQKVKKIEDIASKVKRELKKILIHLIEKTNRPQKNFAEIYVGIGKPVHSLNMIQESYQQAQMALKVLLQIPNCNPIGYYPDLGLWSLLAELSLRKEVSQMYVDHYLKGINRMRNSDELKQLLKAYLLNEGHLKNTAASLYIHPNTLKYRIQKIQDETGLDLTNHETRLNMDIALRLEHLRAESAADHR